jgi:hypothetical protein
MAASWSLSPKRISSTATASFSLMIGMAPRLEQRSEGVASVVGARAIGEICVREEHLRDGQAHRPEGVLVALHEQALPRGGGGLQPGHVLRTRLQAELLHAQRDGAARDDHHLSIAALAAAFLAAERCADVVAEAHPGVAVEALRADLHDDLLRLGERLARSVVIRFARFLRE